MEEQGKKNENVSKLFPKSVKKRPTGFVAICQCGGVVGALDYQRTDRKEAGAIMGAWLHNGCTIEPIFGGAWAVSVTGCSCGVE